MTSVDPLRAYTYHEEALIRYACSQHHEFAGPQGTGDMGEHTNDGGCSAVGEKRGKEKWVGEVGGSWVGVGVGGA